MVQPPTPPLPPQVQALTREQLLQKLEAQAVVTKQALDAWLAAEDADDAARESAELLMIIKQFETRAEVIADRLNGVWKAVEWWDSCDIGEESVKKALEDYRAN